MRAMALDIASGEKTELQARVVILANGSWEPLPSARQTERRVRRGSDLLAFKANFDNADLAAGLLPVLAFEGGYGGMVVADHQTTTIACCIRADRLAALRAGMPGHSAGEVVDAMLRRECDGVDTALQPAQRRGPCRARVRSIPASDCAGTIAFSRSAMRQPRPIPSLVRA